MVVRQALVMLVDSTTQDGVGQRVALCLYFPAAVDELMTVLCCVYGVQHDGECAAGRILHADRYVDAAGNEAVLLVLNGTCADCNIGHNVGKVGQIFRV